MLKEELWHYEFFMYKEEEGLEEETIDLDVFLKSFIPCVSGEKRQRYLRSIDKVIKAMGEDGQSKVTFDQFLAFQYYLETIEKLKYKVAQYRYIDYEMFMQDIQQFN